MMEMRDLLSRQKRLGDRCKSEMEVLTKTFEEKSRWLKGKTENLNEENEDLREENRSLREEIQQLRAELEDKTSEEGGLKFWRETVRILLGRREVGAEAARGPEYESIPSSLPDRQTFLAPAERDNIREESSLIWYPQTSSKPPLPHINMKPFCQ